MVYRRLSQAGIQCFQRVLTADFRGGEVFARFALLYPNSEITSRKTNKALNYLVNTPMAQGLAQALLDTWFGSEF
jgi:hypothetical protein